MSSTCGWNGDWGNSQWPYLGYGALPMDRLRGTVGAIIAKSPCRGASAGANLTLSGYQTVDGVSFGLSDENAGSNMRILVKDQTDQTQNGIYRVNSGIWCREPDFKGNIDFVYGTSVLVTNGTLSGPAMYIVSSPDPQSVGVDAITFEQVGSSWFPPTVLEPASIASATVTDLGTLAAQCVTVTGSTEISSFGTTAPAGTVKFIEFAASLTLALSSFLIFPSPAAGENLTVQAGDTMGVRAEGSGVWRVLFHEPANSLPVTTGVATLASASTVDLGTVREQSIILSGNATITSFGTSAPVGTVKFIKCTGAPILVNSAYLACPTQQNLQLQSIDCFIARLDAGGVWTIANVQRNYAVEGAMGANFSPASNSDTGEDYLMADYAPGLTSMNLAGNAVRIKAWGVTSTSTNAKRIRAYYSSGLGTTAPGTPILDTGSLVLQGASWSIECIIGRTTGGGQTALAEISGNSTALPAQSYVTASLSSNAAAFQVTGQTTVSEPGSITQLGQIAEMLRF
jgi:hypothetical protein